MSQQESDLALPLKERLDEIDDKFAKEIHEGFYASRLKMEIGMWEKGKAVADYRGVNSAIGWRELERQTDRQRESLKEWNDLYEKYPEYNEFLEKHAKPVAEAWAKKALRPRRLLTEADIPALPKGSFTIIYADPPWQYDFSISNSRAIETEYDTLSLDRIKMLDGQTLPADKDAVLFLWATAPKLIEALDVMSTWEFSYRTNAVWDKEKIGMGYWFRGQHELLLVGTKGDVTAPATEARFPSVIRLEREEHSRKPAVVYEMIEKMFPDQKKIELFARGPERKGWVFWGIEVER